MNFQKHYDSVYKFNDIAGNLTNVSVAELSAQMKVVVEEIGELQDAFDNRDAVELLDGACDGFVTLVGLIQQMEKAGFKVDEALQRVCDNNVTKFPSEITNLDVVYACDNEWKIVPNIKYSCYVFKDGNNKVRKPINFVPVEISDLVPDNFFGGDV
jgi:hypothetical protein